MARVLVIEDDDDTRELYARILAGAGHHVTVAADGEVGVNLARLDRPDLAVVDIFLPWKDGMEVIGELRRDLRGVRIVAVSAGWRTVNEARAYQPVDLLQLARDLGADLAIRKPFLPDVLRRAVDTLLAEPTRDGGAAPRRASAHG